MITCKSIVLICFLNIIGLIKCETDAKSVPCILGDENPPPAPLPSTPTIAQAQWLSSVDDKMTGQLSKFNSMEQKMSIIMATMVSLDTNIKALQERAHVWDIFQHHISAWSDHMKAVDKKLDFLKQAYESQLHMEAPNENRLTQLDFKVHNIYEKVNGIDFKLNDISSKTRNTMTDSAFNVNDVIQKLNSIDKNLRSSQYNGSCRNSRQSGRVISSNVEYSNLDRSDANKLKMSLDRFSLAAEKLSLREFRQALHSNRRTHRSLENIEDILTEIDERTIRLYDSEAAHHKKLEACCQSTAHEISTFSGSADVLLKKFESLVQNMDECRSTTRTAHSMVPVMIENVDDGDDEESGSGSNEIREDIRVGEGGCEKLKIRKNGLYKFDNEQQFCYFGGPGSAWIVIQSRGPRMAENFTRNYSEYERGFGDKNGEFWMGNKNIVQLLERFAKVEMRVEMMDMHGNIRFMEYKTFKMAKVDDGYKLKLEFKEGSARDMFTHYNGEQFSTYDRQNEKAIQLVTRCQEKSGGWWFIE